VSVGNGAGQETPSQQPEYILLDERARDCVLITAFEVGRLWNAIGFHLQQTVGHPREFSDPAKRLIETLALRSRLLTKAPAQRDVIEGNVRKVYADWFDYADSEVAGTDLIEAIAAFHGESEYAPEDATTLYDFFIRPFEKLRLWLSSKLTPEAQLAMSLGEETDHLIRVSHIYRFVFPSRSALRINVGWSPNAAIHDARAYRPGQCPLDPDPRRSIVQLAFELGIDARLASAFQLGIFIEVDPCPDTRLKDTQTLDREIHDALFSLWEETFTRTNELTHGSTRKGALGKPEATRNAESDEIGGTLALEGDYPTALTPERSQISEPITRVEYNRLLEIKESVLNTARRTCPNSRRTDETHLAYVGESVAILRVFELVSEFNKSPDMPVLITGPTGCGKTQIAAAIHYSSNRGPKKLYSEQASNYTGSDENIIK
jgi:hypothetical protein